ncbi:MAG: hypothetical protein KDE26_29700, partial [Bacteroidetes bacterium]|nr:hypothetical protein [Bacteroidota bacterium]
MITLKSKISSLHLLTIFLRKFPQRSRLGLITLILSLILSILPGFSFSQDDPQPAKGGYDVTQVTYKNPAISTRFSGGLWYKGNKQWLHRLLHVNGSLNDGYYQEVGRDEWSVYLEK